MCSPYQHLSITERENILVLSTQGVTISEIARKLNRSPSTVSRELRRNAAQGKPYAAHAAQTLYNLRRERCKRKGCFEDAALATAVRERLLLCWSPEQIAGRLKLEQGKHVVSFVTIYRAIYQEKLPMIPKDRLRRRGRKSRPSGTETRGKLHGHKTIHERPTDAKNRSRYGHWEGDTVRGALNKGCLATFVDRKSRFLVAGLMPDRKACTLNDTLETLFRLFPPSLLRSFTFDHGNEFFRFREVEEAVQTSVFFADPYSAWQRGTNENTNGLIRQYFPKKFDFHSISQQDVDRVVSLLNHRPRKILGFRSPAEVFPFHRLLHLH